ncbi:hypothetical protein Tco_0682410 [Tanacetum coccineum]|uniref:Uncharacterized protein n=1 Tax=Tanacetum coccineum TaxID=301880 RepID=A0ABQ4XR28_9ASTR
MPPALSGDAGVKNGVLIFGGGKYLVPAGKVIIIVSPGRLSLVPTGRVLSPVDQFMTPEGSKCCWGLRKTVGGQVVNSWDTVFNCKEFWFIMLRNAESQYWVKDITYHKEKMLLCKQAKKGVQLQAEQSDWLADTDEEIDEQELEVHYSYMAKIQGGPMQTQALTLSHWNIGNRVIVIVTPGLADMCDNDISGWTKNDL